LLLNLPLMAAERWLRRSEADGGGDVDWLRAKTRERHQVGSV
jgi:hypothetical protein